jgi:SAM-dependent methyltransferase
VRVTSAEMFRTPAEAYDRFIGRYGPGLARALIAAAHVRDGERALDVGCGPGALTAELAALLGARSVAAVDPSEPFVEACRRRLPAAHVEVASAEALPFEDDRFDHALAQLVVNFMADPLAGVREMSRVTRRGGRVSAAVWDYAGEMTLLRAFWDAAAAVDRAAAERDEGQTMRHCTPDELGALWTESGLEQVAVSSAVIPAVYDGFEDLWRPLESGVGPAGSYTASLAPDRRAALKEQLRRELGVGDRGFRLTARSWIVTGRVASAAAA